MVLSASSVLSLTSYGSAWYFFQRQLIWTLLGVVAFAVIVRIDYHRWQDAVRPLLIATSVLLVAVLVPGIGIYVGGSRRWLGIGAWRFQPSEIAKLALLLFAADLLTRREDELYDTRRVLKPLLLVTLAIAALVCLEPDLDSTVLLALIVGAVMVAGGISARYLATARRNRCRRLGDPRGRGALPARPRLHVPRPDGGRVEHRLPDRAVPHRARQRRDRRGRARRRAIEVAVPPERAHRLHLRRDR